MAVRQGAGKGKKTRKYGRKRRKPAQIRYTNSRRWITNKIKKVKKIANKTMKIIRIKIDGEWKNIKPEKNNA